MGCTNASANVGLVPGSPVNLYTAEYRTDAHSFSTSNITCNTGAGACAQTAPGSGTLAWDVTRINTQLPYTLKVSAYKVPAGGQIFDFTLVQNNVVGQMVSAGDSVQAALGGQSLSENEKLVICVWFPYPDPNSGVTIPSLAGISTISAQACS